MAALDRLPPATVDGKINAEGRVVVPVSIRRLLGVGSGDRLLFVTDDAGNVRLTSVKAMIEAVWANNHGGEIGEAGNAGEDVRSLRDADHQQELDQMQEISEQDAADTRTDDEVAAALFADLGL